MRSHAVASTSAASAAIDSRWRAHALRHSMHISRARVAHGRPWRPNKSVNEPVEMFESPRDASEDEDADEGTTEPLMSEEARVLARIAERREALFTTKSSRQRRVKNDEKPRAMQIEMGPSYDDNQAALEAIEEEEKAIRARALADMPELRAQARRHSAMYDEEAMPPGTRRSLGEVREQNALNAFSKSKAASKKETELVWVFERRGEGWGEEILPTIKAERRLVEQAPQKALSQGEAILVETFGISEDDAIAILSAAAAWRVTKMGRALVDKRRLRLAQQNVGLCTKAMIEAGASVEDVANIVREVPQILSVIPGASTWNSKFIEYVVRSKAKGGGALGPIRLKAYTGRPRYDRPVESLKPWVLEQRERRIEGDLSQEQAYLLDVAGFDKDTYVPVLRRNAKAEWESSFDELVEFQLGSGQINPSDERSNAGLGAWLEQQKEAYRQGKLSEKREARLRRIGIAFDTTEAVKDAQKVTSIRDVTVEPVEIITVRTSFIESAMELREFLDKAGEHAEPEIGSPIGVWLLRLRQRCRDNKLSAQEQEILATLNIDATYIPESWIAMLNMYANLRARRSSYLGVDIDRIRAWQREQFELVKKNDGSLSEAQIKRLRHAGMIDSISGLAATAINRDKLELDRRREEWAARVAARKAKTLENNSDDGEDK
mmetsp:Transcript_8725/g.32492  ORF Transcript_8725/g.32492 Transcript_8725/m.32492 type:complete len:665 (-) Transcript_8725:1098-3092(-)